VDFHVAVAVAVVLRLTRLETLALVALVEMV
jgi:hypothetical protein